MKNFVEEKLIEKNGYLVLPVDGKNLKVHEMVADVFVCNEYKKTGCNNDKIVPYHINGNKLDNRAVNLVWLSKEDYKLLNKKIESVIMFANQDYIEWKRMHIKNMNLKEIIELIEFTEIHTPLFFEKIKENKSQTFKYVRKYSGDSKQMKIIMCNNSDTPETVETNEEDIDYTIIVKLKKN